jgi:hypothetical protein
MADGSLLKQQIGWRVDEYGYSFENFFHPLVGKLIQRLNGATGDPVAALLDPSFLDKLETVFFGTDYQVAADQSATVESFPKAIDLDHNLPYANYNWELLYHIPVAVAVHLSQNQRFAEAQKWFHYVFDPTSKDLPVDPPARFWKFLYFRKNPATLDLAALLSLLSTPDAELQPGQSAQKQDLLTGYEASCSTPFQPFAVARTRTVAFQYYVVMKYLDNLIGWGDSLFANMTVETVNEATLCYVLAANLLGPRPQPVPEIGTRTALNYRQLKAKGPDPMGNALVDLEGQFPLNFATATDPSGPGQTGPLFGMGRSLYFCVPPNAKLAGYWDTVEDRLSKIRNCENLQGQVQLMPLFDPPIDPGMLIRAAAAGLDIGTIVSGLNQPVGPVRSLVLIQKALELATEVRALGASLLAATEKGDAEQLVRLRQSHEIALQTMMQDVRYLQWKQTQAATEALLRSRATAYEKYAFYLRLLGLKPDGNAPETFTVSHDHTLTEENFDDAFAALVGKYDLPVTMQAYPKLTLAQAGAPASQSGAAGTGQLYLNQNEDTELNQLMPAAADFRMQASQAEQLGTSFRLLPSLDVDMHFWGLGLHSKVFGGDMLAELAKMNADLLHMSAGVAHDQGEMVARTAGFQRRADDWLLQANLAGRELAQLGRLLLTSLITEQAARQEHATARAQVGQGQDVLAFLQSKFSNTDLYGWMRGELSGLYYQYYRFALDTARRAEQTMKVELRRPELDTTTYVQPNYWDSGHRGLLSGESLYLDVKRMELDYHTHNLRELELTRHVSLRQLDPAALLALKVTGRCTLTIPEWLYDRDCPGHYMRRIKTVAVSIPSVVGPYTSVNCTLTLQHSTVRVSPVLAGGKYERDADNTDARFVDYYGSTQSVVTSAAVLDSGMFETNMHDERFLPFEGAGAVSTWSLALPPLPSFDYGTITDVVLHVRYTTRDGGAALAAPATKAVRAVLAPPSGPSDAPAPLALLVDLRHDFPTEWYAFSTGTGDFTATLTTDFFPYLVQHATLTIDSITLLAGGGGRLTRRSVPVPPAMATDLKTTRATALTLPTDATILTRDADQIWAVITYHARV